MIGQTPLESFLEVLLSRALGFAFGLLGNYIILNSILGLDVSFAQNMGVTFFFMIWSIIFNYFLRRFWNYLLLRKYSHDR